MKIKNLDYVYTTNYNAAIYVTLHRKISHNAENERGNRSSTKLKLTNLLFYT